MKLLFRKCPPLLPLLILAVTPLSGAAAPFAAGSNSFAGAPNLTEQDNYSADTSLLAFTSEPNEPGHRPSGEDGAKKTAWWTWTAPATGYCTVDTLNSAASPSYLNDTVLSVYTGNSLAALTRIAASDDYSPYPSIANSSLSRTSFYAQKNMVYRIAVDGYSAGSITAERFNVVLQIRLMVLEKSIRSALWATALQSENMGSVTVTTTPKGSLSGKFAVGRSTYSFGGVIGADGSFAATFAQKPLPGKPPLPRGPITLQLDLSGKGRLRVLQQEGNYSAELPKRAVFNALEPNFTSGLFTIVMPPIPADPPIDIGGVGTMTMKIKPDGSLTAAGVMTDGTTVTFASGLHMTDSGNKYGVSGFRSLFAGKGSFLAIMNLLENGAVDTLDESYGFYQRPPTVPASVFYPLGIDTQFLMQGGTYKKPLAGQRPFDFLTNPGPNDGKGKLVVTNSGGELAGSFTENLILSLKNKFTFESLTRKPSLKLNVATGVVTGSITEPAGKKRNIRGILVHDGINPQLAGYVTGAKRNILFQVTP